MLEKMFVELCVAVRAEINELWDVEHSIAVFVLYNTFLVFTKEFNNG